MTVLLRRAITSENENCVWNQPETESYLSSVLDTKWNRITLNQKVIYRYHRL